MTTAYAQVAAHPKLTTTEIAHENRCHPSAPIRWIQNGVTLSTGERLKLKATRTPGAWLVEREDLDDFLARLTTDRAGKPDTAIETRKAARTSDRVARMRAELAAEGF